MRRKKVLRKDIPHNKDSLWLYDNYEQVIKNFTDPTVVTEAIYDEKVRNFVMLNLKK